MAKEIRSITPKPTAKGFALSIKRVWPVYEPNIGKRPKLKAKNNDDINATCPISGIILKSLVTWNQWLFED